jgi:hypothetical protein
LLKQIIYQLFDMSPTLPAWLVAHLGYQETLNHYSTRMSTMSPDTQAIVIQPGYEDRATQSWMRSHGIKGCVGVTPTFPRFNPHANDEENCRYIREFEQKAALLEIKAIPAWGEANDFPKKGGCFILIDVDPMSVLRLMGESQLSFLWLPPVGIAQLVSCLEPYDLPLQGIAC